MVGQPDDLIFIAGTPEIKLIPDVFVLDPSVPEADCPTVATSTIAGIKVEQTYACDGYPDRLCDVQQTNIYDGAADYYPARQYFLPIKFPVAPETSTGHEGALPIHFDGSTPAGTVGSIVFYQRGSDTGDCPANCRVIGSVNVYVIAPGTETQAKTWFKITSSVSNIAGDTLIINNPLINGNAQARVFVQHSPPAGGGRWNHPVAAYYVAPNWRIRNEDAIAMPTGLTFNVRIDPSALKLDTAYSGQGAYLTINHPLSNGNPYATIIAAPFSAGTGSTRRYMNHPFSIVYNGFHWLVHFPDGAAMPASLVTGSRTNPTFVRPGFFVKVIATSEFVDDNRTSDPSGFAETQLSNGAGVDIVASPGRMTSNGKILNQFCWSINTNNPAIATFTESVLPSPAPIHYNWFESKYYGVGSFAGGLTVFHEDGTYMDGRTPFNVWAPYRSDCPPLPLRYRPPVP